MAMEDFPANRVLISRLTDSPYENNIPCGVAITPGMLVENFKDTDNKLKWRPNSSATNMPTMAVAIENTMANRGVDVAYSIGDRALIHFFVPGEVFWGIVPSGQNIALGDMLQSNGDGKLKAATAATAAANVARFQCVPNLNGNGGTGGAVTADTRIRVQVIS